MLSNTYFLAKFRFDTAENEPAKNLQNFRKMHFRKMHFRKMHFSKMHYAFFENEGRHVPGVPDRVVAPVRAHAAAGPAGPGGRTSSLRTCVFEMIFEVLPNCITHFGRLVLGSIKTICYA